MRWLSISSEQEIQIPINVINRLMKPKVKFQVRFADTGNPYKFDEVSSIEELQHILAKQYRIDKCNQKIVSKKGIILTSQNKLECENLLKKTFSGDANNPSVMSEHFGMYLFNHKQLLRNHNEERNINVEAESQSVLQKMRQTSQPLRAQIYELEPFQKKFSPEEIIRINMINPSLQHIANSWHKMSVDLVNIVHTYKQNEGCFDEYIQRWENQRKALLMLCKNLQILTTEKKPYALKLTENFNSLKTKFEQEHNVQNLQKSMGSSLNQNPTKKQRSSYQTQFYFVLQQFQKFESKVKSLNSHMNAIMSKSRDFKRYIKLTHVEPQKQIKQLDEFKRRRSKELQESSNMMKSYYISLIEGIKQKLQKGSDSKLIYSLSDVQSVEQKLRRQHETGIRYNDELQKKFVQMFTLYSKHFLTVKAGYRTYNEIYVELEENFKSSCNKLQNQFYNLYKNIEQLAQYKNQQDQLNSKSAEPEQNLIPQIEQTQYKRRTLFNTKLQCLQQQIKQILKQQENSRKKYMEDMFLINQMYDNQILSNIRVPCLLFNFDESSDRELMAKMKNSSRGKDMRDMKENGFSQIDVEMYREYLGMDRILRELQIVKNCQISLKSDNIPNQSKIKNLQTLLEKSSDIFHRIYTHKLSLLTKQHSISLQSHLTRITTLEAENKQLHHRIYTYTQNISSDIQNKKQMEIQVEKLRNQLEEAIVYRIEIENNHSKNAIELENKIKAYQSVLESNKKQVSSLKQQKRVLQQNLNNLVSSTQTLFTEIQNSSQIIKQLKQLNHEYKIVMGDQAIKITTLQTQLQILRQQQGCIEGSGTILNDNQNQLKQSFYGNILNQCMSKPQNKNLIHQQPTISQNLPQQDNIQQTVIVRKSNKLITTEELKQIQREIGKFEKQIEELKEENEQLRKQNDDLNKEILEIAMKDTQDVEMQTEDNAMTLAKQNSIVSNNSSVSNQYIKIDNTPQTGQLRIFLPFTTGLYIAIKTTKHSQPPPYSPLNYLTSETRNYINIHQTQLITHQQQSYPYILDMNCLSTKARELLTQCTLIVVLRVSKILPGSEKYYVEGEIVSAMGFEDEDLGVKDYGPFLR